MRVRYGSDQQDQNLFGAVSIVLSKCKRTSPLTRRANCFECSPFFCPENRKRENTLDASFVRSQQREVHCSSDCSRNHEEVHVMCVGKPTLWRNATKSRKKIMSSSAPERNDKKKESLLQHSFFFLPFCFPNICTRLNYMLSGLIKNIIFSLVSSTMN